MTLGSYEKHMIQKHTTRGARRVAGQQLAYSQDTKKSASEGRQEKALQLINHRLKQRTSE